MCGIAGLLGITRERALPPATRMLAALRHREPDDRGTEVISDPSGSSPPAVLVHSRLAIIDLSAAGHQPMRNQPADECTKPNWIAYNGEIVLADFATRHGPRKVS